MSASPTELTCQQCGASPAVKVKFQSLQGQIVMHTIRTKKGTFCRDCGLNIKNEMNSYTLKHGWYSVSGLIGSPIFLLQNSIRAGKLNKLPVPARQG
jgi:spore coat protein CotF